MLKWTLKVIPVCTALLASYAACLDHAAGGDADVELDAPYRTLTDPGCGAGGNGSPDASAPPCDPPGGPGPDGGPGHDNGLNSAAILLFRAMYTNLNTLADTTQVPVGDEWPLASQLSTYDGSPLGRSLLHYMVSQQIEKWI